MHFLLGLIVGCLLGFFCPGVIRRLRAEAKQKSTQFAEVVLKDVEKKL